MKSKAWIAAMAVLALNGCQGASQQQQYQFPVPPPPQPSGVPVSLSPDEVSVIQNGVRGFLKDPASAIFSGTPLAARAPNGEITACGMVNAKNSYGGYTGAGPYIAKVRGGVVVDMAASSGRDASILLQMCRQSGVPV